MKKVILSILIVFFCANYSFASSYASNPKSHCDLFTQKPHRVFNDPVEDVIYHAKALEEILTTILGSLEVPTSKHAQTKPSYGSLYVNTYYYLTRSETPKALYLFLASKYFNCPDKGFELAINGGSTLSPDFSFVKKEKGFYSFNLTSQIIRNLVGKPDFVTHFVNNFPKGTPHFDNFVSQMKTCKVDEDIRKSLVIALADGDNAAVSEILNKVPSDAYEMLKYYCGKGENPLWK